MTKIINNFSEILDKYDFFILDQWGVMHDGHKGYKHAINAVNQLITQNKQLIIISNSSKRKNSSTNRLKDLGFNKNDFTEIMTSGEMIWQELYNFSGKYDGNFKNCFHIYDKSKEDGKDFRIGLEKFEFVNNIKESDFILACTPFKNTKPIDYIPILNHALEMKLIMFCANPDFVTIENSSNNNVFCMGTIADLYEHIGGRVVILGKPSKQIYLEAFNNINALDLSKIIAVGDSIDHDILGATNFGIDSVLISNGIHKDLFRNSLKVGLNNIEIWKKWNVKPTYICENFSF
ncbi:TIGR01459 family HAD-type hydrolase [Pelagibacterales bacterium SAG-MED31]|nr:TIGR01459 family HAD-type hydrolase [Pelagibacterales bacterium SAG-MED31]